MTNKIKIKVDGVNITIDLDSELEIADMSDMDKVAAQMAYWGSIWAAAASESERVDATYRTWRAKAGEAALANDPKLSEWKVKQAIEGDDTFMKFKKAQGEAQRNVILTKGVFESFRIKANMLQSKGAMKRSELDATGMSTRRTPDPKPGGKEDAKSAMRAGNKKRKAGRA